MSDLESLALEREAQEMRFEEFINNPEVYGNPPRASLNSIPTRRIAFIGRDGGKKVKSPKLDVPARLGPNVGYYPGGNDAEEVVRMEDLPDAYLTESQRAARDAAAVPEPPIIPKHRPRPSPDLATYITAARLQPPTSVLPLARLPAYAMTKQSNSPYGASRPPANTRVPVNMDLGMVEICTFIPDWLIIPEVIIRFVRNGADANMLAKVELNATNQLHSSTPERRRGSLSQLIAIHSKTKFNIPDDQPWNITYAHKAGPENDLTAKSWTNPTDQHWGAWKLKDIYSQVPGEKWPTGEDRLLLTQCLEFGATFPHHDLDTSHIPWLVRTLRLRPPAVPASGNRDQAAVARLRIAGAEE